MAPLAPIRLQDQHVLLEPLQPDHAAALERAAADGELWDLWFTGVPAPGQASGYIEKALQGHAQGLMLPFAVREAGSGEIVGTTRFYDFAPELPRMAETAAGRAIEAVHRLGWRGRYMRPREIIVFRVWRRSPSRRSISSLRPAASKLARAPAALAGSYSVPITSPPPTVRTASAR